MNKILYKFKYELCIICSKFQTIVVHNQDTMLITKAIVYLSSGHSAQLYFN